MFWKIEMLILNYSRFLVLLEDEIIEDWLQLPKSP